jgi:hypothetical protein
MKISVSSALLAMVMIALMPQSGDASQSKGSSNASPPTQMRGAPAAERKPQQDPAKLEDAQIYGHELMSADELARYRKQLAQEHTAADRARYQREHEERMRQRAMEQSKDLVPPGQGPIYGGALMSVEERNEYRETLRNVKSDAERSQFEARHREEIQKRAKALRIDIEEAE